MEISQHSIDDGLSNPEDCSDLKVQLKYTGCSESKMNVFLRIRPLNASESIICEEETNTCVTVLNKESVCLKSPVDYASYRSRPIPVNHTYTFTKVYGPDSSQNEFYSGAVKKLVQSFVQGQNCLFFSYGATNSGKTYTVQGTMEQPGILPKALKEAFANLGHLQTQATMLVPVSNFFTKTLSEPEIKSRKRFKETLLSMVHSKSLISEKDIDESQSLFDDSQTLVISSLPTNSSVAPSNDALNDGLTEKVQIWVSFAEIYNEQAFDLLFSGVLSKRPILNLCQDTDGNSYIKGLNCVCVESYEEAYKLLILGRRNLHMAATKLNHQSSRSHSIFTLSIVRFTSENFLAYVNSFSFCDLAGSERVMKTQNTGKRLKEAGNINTSLMVLGRCIEALRKNQETTTKCVVPYRDSKLTRLFQAFFNGKGKAVMVVNISPCSNMFDDTANVLKFAALAKQVVSTDQLDHTSLSISDRLTEMWIKGTRRLSSMLSKQSNQKISIDTITEETLDEEVCLEDMEEVIIQQDETFQEMSRHLLFVQEELRKALYQNRNLEEKVRQEAAEEYYEKLDEILKGHREDLANQQARETAYYETKLNLKCQSYEKRIKLLEEKVNYYENDEGDEEESDEEQSVQITALQSENADLKAQMVQLQSDLEAQKTYCKESQEIKTQLCSLLDEHEKLQSEVNSRISNSDHVLLLEKELSMIKEKNLKLSQASDKNLELCDSIKELEKMLKAKEQELEQEISLSSKTEDALEVLREEVSRLKEEMKKERLEHEVLNKSIVDLKEKRNHSSNAEELLKALREEVVRLKDEVKKERIEQQSLKRSNDKLKEEKENQFADVKLLTQELAEEKTSLSKLGDVLLEKDEEIEALSTLLLNKDKEIQHLLEQIKDKETKIEISKGLSEQCENLISQKKEAMATIQNLEALVEQEKKIQEELKDQLKQKTDEVETLKAFDDFGCPSTRPKQKSKRTASNASNASNTSTKRKKASCQNMAVVDTRSSNQSLNRSPLVLLERYIRSSPAYNIVSNIAENVIERFSPKKRVNRKASVRAKRTLYTDDSDQLLIIDPIRTPEEEENKRPRRVTRSTRSTRCNKC